MTCKLRCTAPVGVTVLWTLTVITGCYSHLPFLSIFAPHIHVIKTPGARSMKLLLAGGHPGQPLYLDCGYMKLVDFCTCLCTDCFRLSTQNVSCMEEQWMSRLQELHFTHILGISVKSKRQHAFAQRANVS